MQVPSRQKGNQTERKKKEQAKTKPHDVADKGLKTREQMGEKERKSDTQRQG